MYNDFLNEFGARFPNLPPHHFVTILMDEYEIDRPRATRAVHQWMESIEMSWRFNPKDYGKWLDSEGFLPRHGAPDEDLVKEYENDIDWRLEQ